MTDSQLPRTVRMPAGQRRQSIVAAYANGAVWGIGSGLASTTLVTYLAGEYGAEGLAISWLVAAPSIAGLLRLSTPYWLDRVPSRRRFCAAMFLASAVLLALLPLVSAPEVLPTARQSIVALVLLWVGYRVLEYIAAVTLWSWFGDLVPSAIRGRFVGRRQAWMNVGRVVGFVVAAVVTYLWMNHCDAIDRADLKWRAYAACSLASAVMVVLSIWPLMRMVDLPVRRADKDQLESLWNRIVRPLFDSKFRRLLWFGLWFSFSNGLTQTARFVFIAFELEVPFERKRALDAGSRGVQSLIMPLVGSWVDRHGNVRVLTISQLIIAVAPLFLLVATPENWWLIVGAYVCWIAYAGENVTQPNLMLGLSAPGETPAYASAWFAWTQLAFSLSVLVGGLLFDWLKANFESRAWGDFQITHFVILFFTSWVLKSVGACWAARIRE